MSEWIRVDERPPEDGQDVGFIVSGSYWDGRVLGGRAHIDDGEICFTIPGGMFQASHWTALPDPPETP